MRILRVLCIPFSQQSASTEPLALPDLTHLKPLPCPALSPGLTSPCMWAPLRCPILWPYQPSHVRPSSSALYSGPTTLTGQASLLYPVPRPYYPSQVGPPLPLPPAPAFALPALTGASHIYLNSAIAKLLNQLYSDWKYICKWYSL